MRQTVKTIALAAFCAALMGCIETVDVSGEAPIDDYESWYRVDVWGNIPGHGESYRVIYANDAARQYAHVGQYPVGSVLVKEVRELVGEDQPGDLRYLAVMRKLNTAPPGGRLEGGWQFTNVSSLGADEKQGFTCYERCHVQAPIAGAWLDYGQ